MFRTVPFALPGSLLVCLLVLTAPPGVRSAPADPPPSTDRLNKAIDNIPLADAGGKASALKDHAGKRATVVLFLSFDCPVSKNYTVTLAAMHKKYAEQGVGFVALVPTDDPAAEVAKKAAAFKLPFPVFSDAKLAGAEAFKATATPEVFVLDAGFVLRYRGRIDNQYYGRMKRNPQVTEHDLQAALDAVLAGKDVPVPATRAVGCPVDTRERKPDPAATVTYHRDVAPILQKHCQSCHRPEGAGPFELTAYKHAVSWATDIVQYTHSREMPPWKPSAGGPFANARGLTAAEIETLAKWEKAGCPEGDPKEAPPPLKLADGWNLGEPDLVLELPDEFLVGPSGKDLFRCFVIPTGLKEDRYLVAYEVRPGNAAVVHHTLNYYDLTGNARKLEQKERDRKKEPNEPDRGPGYTVSMGLGFFPGESPRKDVPGVGLLGGWAPGQLGVKFPAGSGLVLPKDSDLVLQIHYHRTGKPEKDRTKVGLYFAAKPPEKTWQTLAIGGMSIFSTIPAGKADHREKGSGWLSADCYVHSLMPHMHLLGKSVKVTMTPPGGDPVVLLEIKHWDYNWQESYWFAKPILAKAGTRFDIEAVFDNSADNPSNPNRPPKPVGFGEETTDEMLFGFFGVTPAGEDRVRMLRADPKK